MQTTILIAAAAALLLSMSVDAQNAQQDKMTSCNSQAKTQSLSGDARKSFMQTCLSNQPAAAPKLNSGLLQIDGLVAAVLVELSAPYLVRALMLGWTEADGRSQPHVEITHGF